MMPGRRRRNRPPGADQVEVRSLRIRLLLPLALVVAVMVVGTLGYYLLWREVNGTWMDANIEDLVVTPDSPTIGRTLEAVDIRRVTGVTILAILREGNPLVSPPFRLA